MFVLLGGALIALTASLAQGSLARAYSQTAPAAAALKQQIAEILRQTQPTSTTAPSTPPGKSPPPGSAVPSGKPRQPARPTDTAAAQSTPDTKQKLLAASDLYSTATRDTAVHDLIIQSIAAAGVLIPLAVLLAWWLAGRSLRPIRRITSAARRATPNRLSERIALTGRRDEITELGDTFDAMMDRLEHAFDAQRRFIANASHELRTPLAIAGTAIDVVLAKPDRGPAQLEAMAGDVREALHRAERLVDSLLALTRSQHLDHPHEPVDLAAIAERSGTTSTAATSTCAPRATPAPRPSRSPTPDRSSRPTRWPGWSNRSSGCTAEPAAASRASAWGWRSRERSPTRTARG